MRIHRALALSIVLFALLTQAQGQGSTRTVERVIDGDTLVLDGGERVRLIGVDTPETVHPTKPVERFGKEASAFTKRTVEGKEVRLEYDQERTDRYGRTLAYVYLLDGSMLNLKIVRERYGHAYTRFPFERMEDFREAERQAREAGRGLWSGDDADSARAEERQREVEEPGISGSSSTSRSCTPREQCCKVCSKGQACGASCISRSYTCRKGRGCACNAAELCR